MPALSTIPLNHARRARPRGPQFPQRTGRTRTVLAGPARSAIPEPDSRSTPAPHRFTPLIDAKAASELLGVPHTWLLAQAREARIPHHRLGHYVRFNPDDLQEWLKETRSLPNGGQPQAHRARL
ncbi:MAG: helix-turn-helix domain-containing protein [Solirubrobacteraceae bacterium]|jgi:excisionase family DNA binding protein